MPGCSCSQQKRSGQMSQRVLATDRLPLSLKGTCSVPKDHPPDQPSCLSKHKLHFQRTDFLCSGLVWISPRKLSFAELLKQHLTGRHPNAPDSATDAAVNCQSRSPPTATPARDRELPSECHQQTGLPDPGLVFLLLLLLEKYPEMVQFLTKQSTCLAGWFRERRSVVVRWCQGGQHWLPVL